MKICFLDKRIFAENRALMETINIFSKSCFFIIPGTLFWCVLTENQVQQIKFLQKLALQSI